ncbi:MAG: hypothetical protein AAGA96_12960, partial [Verrucomicrobiota bacterium]
SDGRHNGETLPEDELRRLAVQNSPLSAIPLGSPLGPVDLSILKLKAPESIYLDDRVVVAAEIRAEGLLGEMITAKLKSDGELVDRQEFEVTDVNFRSELRLTHRPDSKGIMDYELILEPNAEERFEDNNQWQFKVAVTDARTNVLLIDSYPRWEFRYLRNLFFGRDKSVHLQYVLLNPDEIFGAPKTPLISASATRPFGDAEATALPRSPAEWQLFDVIIIGDVPPNAISEGQWKAVHEAVTTKGTLLVCVSGSRHMPHRHSSPWLQELLPVRYVPRGDGFLSSPEPAFHLELTEEGMNHPVTSQSSSRAINQDRWSSFPAMTWRFASSEIKETAEVLAYARPVGAPSISDAGSPDGSPGSVEAALERLANRNTLIRENATISTIRSGLGNVLLLHMDQSWRFRFGVGDTYHHRFWGQITRWGAGPNLRSGNEMTRLGTDHLSYAPGEAIAATAKVLDADRRPVTDASIQVEVWKDGTRLRKQVMSYRSGSSGLYETTFSGLQEEGEYQLKLVGDSISIVGPETPEVSTEFLVMTNQNPIELAELTADRDFLNYATAMTGGRLAEIGERGTIPTSFGAPKETLTEQRNVTLWDSWPMLLTFLSCLTAEWILRRRNGLV